MSEGDLAAGLYVREDRREERPVIADALSRREHLGADVVVVARKWNPAASTRSVGGMNAWAVSKWGRWDSVSPFRRGEHEALRGCRTDRRRRALKREFHISVG